MIEIKRWKSVTDREKWAARGASFVAKAKATKVVWFPPKAAGAARKGASTTKKTAKKAVKKTADPTRKAAKKATRKSPRSATGAAKKASKKAGGAVRKR